MSIGFSGWSDECGLSKIKDTVIYKFRFSP